MRITGGIYRGRTLSSPAGESTRPTSDRARQAIFNILNHASWLPRPVLDGGTVIDAFAGTGALGLEALSHGASHAVFVEQDGAAARACQENIATLKADGACLLLRSAVEKIGVRPAHVTPRDLVFLDPPYGRGLGNVALSLLAENGWLAPDAVCALEMSKKEQEETPEGFDVADERTYGIALVRFMIWRG